MNYNEQVNNEKKKKLKKRVKNCATISKRPSRKLKANLYLLEGRESDDDDDARGHCRCSSPYASSDPHPHLRRL